MVRYDPSRPTMTLTSDSAKSNADRSEFRLYDNVVLRRPAGSNGDTLIVTSDYMLVLTKQELVKTDRPVQAQQGSTTLKGTGMIADSKQQTLALHSAVSATYLPPEQVRR
jgi:LPS export ABC transporter protein LptC